MCRFETGPNGNPHFHGISYAHGNPRLDGVKEVPMEGAGDPGSAAAGCGAARVRVTGEGEEGGLISCCQDVDTLYPASMAATVPVSTVSTV